MFPRAIPFAGSMVVKEHQLVALVLYLKQYSTAKWPCDDPSYGMAAKTRNKQGTLAVKAVSTTIWVDRYVQANMLPRRE